MYMSGYQTGYDQDGLGWIPLAIGAATTVASQSGIFSKLFGGGGGPTRAQKISSTIADCNQYLAQTTTADAVISMINKMSLPSFGVAGRGWPCAVYKVVKAYAPALIPHDCSDQSLVYGKSGDPCAPIPEWLGNAGKTIRATPGWENYIRSFFPPELGGLRAPQTPAIVPTPMPAVPPPPLAQPTYPATQPLAPPTPSGIIIPPSSFPIYPISLPPQQPMQPIAVTGPATTPSWMQPVPGTPVVPSGPIQASIAGGNLMPILLLGGLAGMMLLGGKRQTRYRYRRMPRRR